jgi:protein NrfD
MSMLSAVSGSDSEPGAAAAWKKILWVLWVVLLAAGIVGLVQRLQFGHNAAGYGSYVPWGLWIGLYFLGVGISGGAFFLGAVGYLFRLPGFGSLAELRHAVVLSVAAILPAFLGVTLDLGRMERLPNVLLYPSFTSMMAFNAWMYNAFIALAIIVWLLTFARRSFWLRPLLMVGALLCILFPSQSGVFFAAVRTNAFWHNPMFSVLFLASAIALGAAGLLVVKSLVGPVSAGLEDRQDADRGISLLRWIVLGAVAVYFIFEFAEVSLALWSPGVHSESVVFMVFGGYRAVFWILHLLVGIALPVLFLLACSARAAWILASLLVVVGFAAARMTILVPGQIVEQIPGLQQAFQDTRLVYAYHPTTMEYLVGCLMVAAGMAVFYVGLKLSRTFGSRSEQSA